MHSLSTINKLRLLHAQADILSRFLRREEKALEEVYYLFYQPLCYFADKLVMNSQAAEELVVDAFIKTFRSTVAFSSMDHLRGYLFEAVKNQSLNHLKQEKRYHQHLVQYGDAIRFNLEHFENGLIETQALEHIYAIAATLPAECKRVFDLLYKEQLSYQAIADSLQLNVQTVRNQNARAIAHIRKRLQAGN